MFAVYAVAVAVSLFLVGHLSDWYGRRRVLAPALALEIVAGVVFVVWPQLPGLLLARVVSGLGIGAVTATATAWLAELYAARRPAQSGRAQSRTQRTSAGSASGAGLGCARAVGR